MAIKEKTQVLTNIPTETRNRFKGWCAINSITMTKGVTLLMKLAIKNLSSDGQKLYKRNGNGKK